MDMKWGHGDNRYGPRLRRRKALIGLPNQAIYKSTLRSLPLQCFADGSSQSDFTVGLVDELWGAKVTKRVEAQRPVFGGDAACVRRTHGRRPQKLPPFSPRGKEGSRIP